MNRTRSISTLAILIAAGLAVQAAPATPGIANAFAARYPTSTLPARMNSATGSSCYLCHHPSSTSNPGNCYKEAIATRIAGGMSNAAAINAVDGLDSDNDGVPNGVEILMVRTDIPGAVGYNPGLIGPTGTDPCATNVNFAVTHQPETPPPVCDADVNQDGNVDQADIDYLVNVIGGGPNPTGIDPDFNHDGNADQGDIAALIDVIAGGPCP